MLFNYVDDLSRVARESHQRVEHFGPFLPIGQFAQNLGYMHWIFGIHDKTSQLGMAKHQSCGRRKSPKRSKPL